MSDTLAQAAAVGHVRALYNHLLGREPEPDALALWAGSMRGQPDPNWALSGLVGSDEYRARSAAVAIRQSPFAHYAASFDPGETIRRHAVAGLVPTPSYLTNFIGVLIDPKYARPNLDASAGTVEGMPIPANWHADMAEWGAALRAVDLAGPRFTVVELGCGWGCWINNAGVAARRSGRDVRLVGVEGDPGHIGYARESTAANGFLPSQVVLHHGIAAATDGTALFLSAGKSGEAYGSRPIFGASDAEREAAARTGSHDVLPMVSLGRLAAEEGRIDLLHVDIQGGEADLVAGSLAAMAETVAYLLIGTHSRQIEGRLFDSLLGAGWFLEIERPAIMAPTVHGPVFTVDGVQGWRNPKLLPL